MSANKIKIDLDKLSAALSSYDEAINEFEQSLENTENAINTLKASGWQSGASDAYFLTYEDTWKKKYEKTD